MTTWYFLAVTVGLGTFFCFAGAILFYFRKGSHPARGATFLLISIVSCGVAQVVVLFRAVEAPVWWRLAGVLLFGAAHVVFWSAVYSHGRARPNVAFSPAAPARLVTSGPYRWVRHPFYSAYLLAWVAGTVVTATPGLAVCVAVMGTVYYCAARREEAGILTSPWREEYAAYRRRTGMFIPRFSWAE